MDKKIASFNKRLEAMRSERSTFIALWRELSDHILSHRGRFLTSDRNKGYKRNTKMYNNKPRLAARTLASGMMAGITSPARPWFRLSTSDLELKERSDVKQWLHQVQAIMYEVFSQSNLYQSLHMLYAELGVFGTGAMGVYKDFDNVIRCEPYTVGSYFLAADGRNRIDTFYREYEISVAQCVKQFGLDNCSEEVQRQWRTGNTEAWVKIVHVVEPNDNRDMMSPLAKDMPIRSVYYEYGRKNHDKMLRESGFTEKAILTPRWDVTNGDIYAVDCPGMTALGDAKALQLGERRKYQALDKIVDPPLQAPASMQNKIGKSLRPGEIYWNSSAGDGIKSIYDFRPDLNAMMAINQEAEQRISMAFYEDLFLMLANTDRRQITAREIAERHEEKLLMLGPVLERLHAELLDPLIDRTFNILQETRVLPVAPEALQNRELRVEYVSVLAQAQRLVAVGALDRMAQYVGSLAGIWPDARHKFDAQQAADEYAEALGISPGVLRSDDQVAAIIAAERQQMAQAQAAQQAEVMADVGKKVSEIDTGGDNALTNIMRNQGLL